MSKKVLTGAMAAVMATGMVTPVMAETNETKSLAELHSDAFAAYNTAMDAAKAGKDNATVQKLINEARKASATFLAAYEKETGSNEHNDIPTWSTGLDSIQHPILAKIVDAIVAMDKNPETITQAKLNEVYSLLWNNLADDTDNLAEEYLTGAEHGLSQASDTVQQIFNKKVVAAVEAAKTEKTEAAVAVAKALVEELKTALNPQLVEAAKVLGEEVAKVEVNVPVKVESVTAVGTKNLEVKLTKEVEKLSDITIEVKRGTTKVNLTATLSEDKKSIVLTSASKLVAGDYTVKVSGNVLAEGVTKTLKVETEAAKELNILTESVQRNEKSKLTFEVRNQYGEIMNVTSSSEGLVITAFDKTPDKNGNNTGLIKLTGVSGKAEFTGFNAESLADNDEVVVTMSYKGITVSKTIKVIANSTLESFEISEPSPLEGKTRITVEETLELPYSGLDQYGEEIKLGTDTDGNGIFGNYIFTTSDASIVNANTIKVDDKGKMTFTCGKKAGTVRITAINSKTGYSTSVEFEVSKAAEADVIELSVPNEIVVAGESIKIPFVVYDNYGDVIKPANLDMSKITVTSSNDKAKVAKVGKEIVLTGVSEGNVEIVATIGTKTSKFTIDINAAAKAEKIEKVKDVPTIITEGAIASITTKNFVVLDQYGREYTLKNDEAIKVYVKDGSETSLDVNEVLISDGKITSVTASDLGTAAKINASNKATITGKSVNGTETLVFVLVDGSTKLAEAELDVTTKATTEISEFAIKEISTLYATTNEAYDKDIVVQAKDANGNLVAIPSSSIVSVTSSNTKVATVDKANMKVSGLAKGTAVISVVVNNGAELQTIQTTVTVSDVNPLAQSVYTNAKDGNIALSATELNGKDLDETTAPLYFRAIDQYGTKALEVVDYIVTDLEDNTNDNITLSVSIDKTEKNKGVINVVGSAGDRFKITAVAANGSTSSVVVTISAGTPQ